MLVFWRVIVRLRLNMFGVVLSFLFVLVVWIFLVFEMFGEVLLIVILGYFLVNRLRILL